MKSISPKAARKYLVKIPKDANKGTKGTAAIFAGSYGMVGAAIISASSALKSGAGIVRLCVDDEIYPILAPALPEMVFKPLNRDSDYADKERLFETLKGAKSLLIGPGLSNTKTTKALVENLLEISEVPTIIDADGLNAIVGDLDVLKTAKAKTIVTPHPLEMARLIGENVETVLKNRVQVAEKFAKTYGVITVLKGAYTLIASPDRETYINKTGCEGMATAGSGDMLSGMISAFLANGMEPLKATVCAVCLHGEAGERATKKLGVRSVTAMDMVKELPLTLK